MERLNESVNRLFDSIACFLKDKYTKKIFIATTIMCFIAHGYRYANEMYGHDMTHVSEPVNYTAGIVTTKWLLSPMHGLIGFAYMPWFIGILTAIFMSIVVYCICKSLDINRTLSIYFVAGVCVTNPSIIHGHIFTASDFAGAAAFAMLGTLISQINTINRGVRIVLSAFFIACSAAVYGSYAFASSTLMIVILLLDILKGTHPFEVVKKGIRFVLVFGLGMAIWYSILKVLLKINNAELLQYMSEANLEKPMELFHIYKYIPGAYEQIKRYYLGIIEFTYVDYKMNKMLLIAAIAATALIVISRRKQIQNHILSTILFLVLVMLLPLSMNFTYLVTSGNVHGLMLFATVFFYIYVIKCGEELYVIYTNKDKVCIRIAEVILSLGIMLFVYRGVMLSNMVYLNMQRNYEISLSIGTRIIDRIESCEGLIGNERIVLIGSIGESEYFNINKVDGMERLDGFNYANRDISHVFTYATVFPGFLRHVLGSNLEYIMYATPEDAQNALQFENEVYEKLSQAASFPAEESVFKVNDMVFVKLSEKIE